ncbi:MAG: hypothetical protein EZS28_007130 [Streblomastix strix]|uniref:Armadillo-type fold n=1 Tax=Streblomastix strix TaxID=222440 RepID=A0A5J4WQY1_9EUKA|nr:MAG: hypothetical protein EZS28_007130 [Streblomastix strix]
MKRKVIKNVYSEAIGLAGGNQEENQNIIKVGMQGIRNIISVYHEGVGNCQKQPILMKQAIEDIEEQGSIEEIDSHVYYNRMRIWSFKQSVRKTNKQLLFLRIDDEYDQDQDGDGEYNEDDDQDEDEDEDEYYELEELEQYDNDNNDDDNEDNNTNTNREIEDEYQYKDGEEIIRSYSIEGIVVDQQWELFWHNINTYKQKLYEPLTGSRKDIQDLIKEKDDICKKIMNMFEGHKDDNARIRVLNNGVINGLLYIFMSQKLNTIKATQARALLALTVPGNDELKQRIVELKPFPAILRLMDHEDSDIIGIAVVILFNLILIKSTESTYIQHPYFGVLQACGGIEKIIATFRENQEQIIKDTASFCIGHLYRAKEIPNDEIRRDIIRHLKLVNFNHKNTFYLAQACLDNLMLNEVNRADINSIDQQMDQILQ